MSMNRFLRKAMVAKHIATAHALKRRKPIMANLLLTSHCNLRCFYCYVDTENRQVEDIPYEKVIQLVDELFALGTRVFILLGGEPLLRRDIGDIIRHIHTLGAVCEVITNGQLVEQKIEDLKELDSVCVSLDGPQHSHDLNRGKGSYDVAIKAIDTLLAAGVPTRIKGVMTQNNRNDVDALHEIARQKGIMVTMSLACTYEDREYAQENSWLLPEQEDAFYTRLAELKATSPHIGYSARALRYVAGWPYSKNHIVNRAGTNNPEKYPLIPCLRQDRSLYMDVDGNIYPCANMWGKGGINILELGAQEAWKRFNSFDCRSCSSIPDMDMTLLFSLNMENWLSAARFLR